MVAEFVGIIALSFGLFFCGVGVLGVMRMPDIYTRLHASGKVATLGLLGVLVGTAILMPATSLKLLALGLFMLVTSPLTTHAIAASEHRRKEVLEELIEMQEAEDTIDIESVDVSGYLSRSAVKDVIEAQQRSRQSEEKNGDDS